LSDDEKNSELKNEVMILQSSVKELNNKIEKMEKQSFVGADDQIFLGALLTFITVFLSLQYGDVANFFKSVNSSSAIYSAIILKISSIIFLGCAISLRYWASLIDDSKPNAFSIGQHCVWYNSPVLRYASLESLITGLVLMLVIFASNIIQIVPIPLIESLLYLFVVMIILISGSIEDRILSLFKTRGLIPSDSKPFAQIVFSSSAMLVSISAMSLIFFNLLDAVLNSVQSFQFGPLILSLLNATLSWTILNKPVTFALFMIGLLVLRKVLSRYLTLNSPTKEMRLKTRFRKKREKVFKKLIKRASVIARKKQ
jgi:hypothetical protein